MLYEVAIIEVHLSDLASESGNKISHLRQRASAYNATELPHPIVYISISHAKRSKRGVSSTLRRSDPYCIQAKKSHTYHNTGRALHMI